MVDRDKLRIAGWAVAAVVAVVLCVRLLGAGGGGDGGASVAVEQAGSGGGAAAGDAAGAGPTGAFGGGGIMVQVAGEVVRPGVYRVPAGSRVTDAVMRAGGLTRRADQAGVNLVARVQDGQQVIVPRRGAAGAAAAGASAATGSSAGPGAPGVPVSLSSATVEQLDALDGIGPTLARRIVEYRQAHGGFSSVDQLRNVTGIGEKRLEALRKGVTP